MFRSLNSVSRHPTEILRISARLVFQNAHCVWDIVSTAKLLVKLNPVYMHLEILRVRPKAPFEHLT